MESALPVARLDATLLTTDDNERNKPMFHKEAGQGITEMVVLSAAIVSAVMGIIHCVGTFFGI